MYWVNGKPDSQIPLGDRGLHYGDGCFTTARVHKGKIQLLERHIQRLKQATVLLLMAEIDWHQLENEIQQAAMQIDDGVLKVMLTRGSGGRGYSVNDVTCPTRIMASSPFPQHYSEWREQGIALVLCPLKLAKNAMLAGVKHLNRLEQVLIRAELDKCGAQEGIVLDTDDRLIECCAANFFWRQGWHVFTPRLDHAGVNGIMRQHIMSVLADSPYQLEEVSVPFEALALADEVFICNALMPIIPVKQIEGWSYSSHQLYDYLSPFC